MAGFECKPVSAEITYGLERICMYIQNKNNVYDLDWNNYGVKYGDVFLQAEKELVNCTSSYRLIAMWDRCNLPALRSVFK